MVRTYCAGGEREEIICPKCTRVFSGSKRNADKLISMHLKKSHNTSEKILGTVSNNCEYDIARNQNRVLSTIII